MAYMNKSLLPIGVEPRDEAFRLYWHFASRRQDSFYRRLNSLPSPWSEDAIIEQYKFCNVFRVSDRVTQDMLKSAIYSRPALDMTPLDRVFRTIVYRFFSEPLTWAYLDEAFGPLTASTFDEKKFNDLLDQRLLRGEKLYTGAFILCATRAFGYDRKHHNHAALFASLLVDGGAPIRSMLMARSLGDLYSLLRKLPLIGKFMAYQIAIDINYGPDIDFSESSFVAAGPGAERGLRKCFASWGGESPETLIQWVAEHQEELAAEYGYSAPRLFGRRLQSIDCQGLFCETDKYCRVALPHLRSSRSRIKATFQPRPTLDKFFSPPKWQLETTSSKLVA
jgi:hypothetical protein